MSFKLERLEKILEREISTIIMNSKDERLNYVVITGARLTKDLSIATVFYIVRGEEESVKEEAINSLNKAKGFIRSSLAKVLEIKKIPELKFKYDDSLNYWNKIDNILKGLN